MTAATTVIISEADEFASLEPEWWKLWKRCPAATPFQSPAWLLSWWDAFAPGRLRVGAAFQEGRLTALFPFYREEGPLGRRLLPIGISLSDYLDVLADPAMPAATRALVAQMTDEPWDEWAFEELAPGAATAELPCPAEVADAVAEQSICPMLELRGGEDLRGCVPARRRRQTRRAWTVAARLGEVRVEPCTHNSQRFLDALLALHAARWREQGGEGVLADERVLRFHRAALPRLAAAGLARCWLLTLDGQPIGAYYGFFDRGRAYAYLGGFSPAHAEASPGSILIGHAIAEAIAEGASEFHFLRGREAYKYSWGARDRHNRRRVWSRLGYG